MKAQEVRDVAKGVGLVVVLSLGIVAVVLARSCWRAWNWTRGL